MRQPGEFSGVASHECGPVGEGDASDEVVQRADGEPPPFQIHAHLRRGAGRRAVERKHRHDREEGIELTAPLGWLLRFGNADLALLQRH